ncbi:hypothetical protein EJB05_53564 [Eragrostis curvula]|uniref:Bowman-Birk serine protease inhibitors family domain-containing protein n=1 Tax=Eragrostis curvula TaxID=38414 RepID=A0A5J9SPY4_9POAL|nr:hypothetical protein EJB05_53564 [Eragrostis curvula]
MGGYSNDTVVLVTGFLFIVVVASSALGRPQAPNAGGRLTYASTNVAATNSTTSLLDERKDCDLTFCTKQECDNVHGGGVHVCYCCIPNPKLEACYSTMKLCKESCGVCKTKRSQ